MEYQIKGEGAGIGSNLSLRINTAKIRLFYIPICMYVHSYIAENNTITYIKKYTDYYGEYWGTL